MFYIVINAYFDTFVVNQSELCNETWAHVSRPYNSREQAEACLVDYLCPEEMFQWA